jgi:hypothetical protein
LLLTLMALLTMASLLLFVIVVVIVVVAQPWVGGRPDWKCFEILALQRRTL